ncbi:hypothetical protein [Anaeroselena agilis]|uniref:Uncharacterized protein n=1 Tax=Anaeroselena agilis TaxID=3063788 RepID=A0ABU3P521_9FIRM|nr:hypothetical protein [Selenomonadales bacterium 4137-cl]
MADFKRHMFRHLRSAKVWLTRAEESFDNNSKIRGELNLILAQAELQHAKEASLFRQERRQFPLLRQAAPVVFAATIVAAGFGAYWGLSERHTAVPIPLAAREAKTKPVVQKASDTSVPHRAEEQRPAISKATGNTPPQTIPPAYRPESFGAQRPESIGRMQAAEKENLLSPDEMKDVIRAAGRSLRGQ